MLLKLMLLISLRGSESRDACSNQPKGSDPSGWADHLHELQAESSDMFFSLSSTQHVMLPELDSGASLSSHLQSKFSELSGLINGKKDVFTWDELRRTYHYYDLSLQTVRYDFLVPRILLTDADDMLMAYDVFQRLASAVEVVRLDMIQHGDMTVRTAHLWQKIDLLLTDILELLYITSAGQGDLLARDVLPLDFRCVRDSVSRDIRDFLVMRHTFEVALFYRK